MVKLWRCEICGDPYIGDEAPANCPFCGAKKAHIKEFKEAIVDFDVELNKRDKENAEKALQVEISNAGFYFCAAKKTDDREGKLLFKALGKVEAEHANIWKKILKLEEISIGEEKCNISAKENLEESHARETRAIEFYKKAAKKSENKRTKQIFEALVGVETDHLNLSENRLNKRKQGGKKMVKVRVYSTPICIWCKNLKDFLNEKKIEFEEFDVSTDAEARKEMLEKSNQAGVPVIDINGKIIIGFDKEEIEAELEKQE